MWLNRRLAQWPARQKKSIKKWFCLLKSTFHAGNRPKLRGSRQNPKKLEHEEWPPYYFGK